MNPPRLRPKLDEYNRAFWTGGAEGKLQIQKCNDCNGFNHPPPAAVPKVPVRKPFV